MHHSPPLDTPLEWAALALHSCRALAVDHLSSLRGEPTLPAPSQPLTPGTRCTAAPPFAAVLHCTAQFSPQTALSPTGSLVCWCNAGIVAGILLHNLGGEEPLALKPAPARPEAGRLAGRDCTCTCEDRLFAFTRSAADAPSGLQGVLVGLRTPRPGSRPTPPSIIHTPPGRWVSAHLRCVFSSHALSR
jgi:hypothetical protein